MNFFRHRKKQNNRKGVVLVTVVMVMCVAFILIGAITGFVRTNTNRTIRNYRKQQAFLTASTYLENFVAEIEKQTTVTASEATDKTAYDAQVANRTAFISKLKALASSNAKTTNVTIDGTNVKDKNMGEVELSIKNDGSSSNLVIMAKCTYLGESDQIAAHITVPTASIPGTYNNAVEYAGDSSILNNNGNFIGSVSRINSKGTSDAGVVYEWKNDCKFHSGYFVYGSVKSTVHAKFEIQKAFVADTDGNYNGCGVTISRDLDTQNEFMVNSTMPYTSGFNYVNVGGTYKTNNHNYLGCVNDGTGTPAANMVDTWCTGFENNDGQYYQNGNLYVKKVGGSSTTPSAGGHATISGGGSITHIYGDMYVEGNLTINACNTFRVDGNLYVGGTLTGTPSVGGNIYTNTTSSYKDAPAAPEIPLTMNEYIYDAGYILASGDDDAKSIATEYSQFYGTSANETTLKQIVMSTSDEYEVNDTKDDPSHTPVTLKFHRKIEDQSFTLDDSCFSGAGSDYNNNHKQKKYLIVVKNQNVLIRLKNLNAADSQYKTMFVVKNESPVDSKGNRKYGCYFVSDSGMGTGNVKENGVKKRTGMNSVQVNIANWGILDYDTYRNVWDKDDLPNSSYNAINPDKSVVLNTTDTSEASLPSLSGGLYYYTPHKGNIHVIMSGDNSKLSSTAGSSSFFECEFYCPDVDINLECGSNEFKLLACDADGKLISESVAGGANVVNIGMMVCKSLLVQNTSFIIFNQPDPSSFWGPLKGNKAKNLAGYKLSMYNYY